MSTPNPWPPQAVAATSTGRVRNSNEDAYGCRPDRGIFIVCDGMGGAAGGEIASSMTVQSILDRVTADSAAGPETLHEAIAEANRAVLERGDRDAGLYGMGTTLVVLLLREGVAAAVIAHAGDSRCYLYRARRLSRCTHDHSLVDEQLRLGTMTREEAERSPFRSVITRAIGTQQTVTEDMQEIETQPGDVFLLCSDGLTREVDEDEIARVIGAGPDLDRIAHRLVDEANEAGGRDNVTCLLVRVP
ncbi:MAG TPA: Stp1/IreP family PP2C-type Ser/Thr phosphatase [Acidobacteriaceae bacterium]|jgi:PPM family protein phosphatase|nr:Stp1/IreP family PP2C-type Ser/Thr phosphatase [Acidobacteriaceae bacterium]